MIKETVHNNNMSWMELLDALDTTHTVSIRTACQDLKTSRQWVNKYILPFVNTVYISNGYVDGFSSGVHWSAIAGKKLNKPINETVWLNTDEYTNLLIDSVSSITKRTKRIPVEYLLDDIEAYRSSIEELKDELQHISSDVSIKEIAARTNEINSLWVEYLSDFGKDFLSENSTHITRRGEVEPVQIEMDIEPYLSKLTSPHDMKKYGDTDEQIYRQFFSEGWVRVEMTFQDKNSNIGQKIYYIPDTEPIAAECSTKFITVKESGYRQYKDKFDAIVV